MKQDSEELPPSLKCQLCSCLIVDAAMTPCCFSSCCYECLSRKLASSTNRVGACPMVNCREQDVLIQDVIPNLALRKAADWFTRQQIAQVESVTIETQVKERPGDIDVVFLGRKLIEDAQAQDQSGGKGQENEDMDVAMATCDN